MIIIISMAEQKSSHIAKLKANKQVLIQYLPLLSFLCTGDNMVHDLNNAQDNSYRMNVHKVLSLAQKTI